MVKDFGKLLLAWGLVAAASLAVAQDSYPSKPIKLIVPYAAGGPADLLARTVAERLGPRLGQPVLIENKTGAGGHLGGELVAKGAVDGYTLMLGTIAHNGAVKLYSNLRYDPLKDLQPVALIAESPSVLIVNQKSPIKSVAELLVTLRSQPGKMSYGSAGNGSAMHMAAELFRYMAKVDYVHVPYRGGAPAMADLLGGQVDMLFESLGTAHPHLKSGKVRALAVTGTARNASLPDVPTLDEAVEPVPVPLPVLAHMVAAAASDAVPVTVLAPTDPKPPPPEAHPPSAHSTSTTPADATTTTAAAATTTTPASVIMRARTQR